MTTIYIENIVAKAKIAEQIDIPILFEEIPNSQYNPEEFKGLTIKSIEPKIAIIIMPNGKLVCTGAKEIDEAKKFIKQTIRKIKTHGFEIINDYEIKIENIVASSDLKKEMDLSSISQGLLLQNVNYQPEQFPGLIYQMDDKSKMLLLFSSGKIVCLGAVTIEEVTDAIDMMKEKLSSIGAL